MGRRGAVAAGATVAAAAVTAVAAARRGTGRPRAVVVGSGAAGATVARVLARSGLYDVLVLEKGPLLHPGLGGDIASVGNMFAGDELAYEIRPSPFAQDPLLEPRSFRPTAKSGMRTFVGEVNNLPTLVGGATAHYDAKARRLREVDFLTNSLLGGGPDSPAIAGTTYTDWPMRYAHLEPFYAVMEELVGVQGPAYRDGSGAIVNPNPLESPRSTPFAMPPGVAMYSNLVLADAARRLGLHPAPVPTAVNSRPYRGRPACNDCAFCLDFGCPIAAKGGGIWLLHDALRTGRVELRSESTVVRLEVAGGSRAGGLGHVEAVTYIDAEGSRQTETADLVVLACTPIEAVRLALRSGIGAPPDERDPAARRPAAGDPGGLLGRNLMFHRQTVVYGVFDQDLHPHRGRTSTHTIDDLAGSGPSPRDFDASIPRGGILELGGNANPIFEAMAMTQVAHGAALKRILAVSPFRRHLNTLTMQGEDMPQLTNAVDLDPEIVDVLGEPVPRITYSPHRHEVEAANRYTPRLQELLGAVGGTGSAYPELHALEIGVNVPDQVPNDKHIMGTHRMALDSEHGVCTPYGRMWAFDNLYCAGGGLFPTAPGYNPTLTIWALSYWVAAAIVSGLGATGHRTAAQVDAGAATLTRVIAQLDADTMIARRLGRTGVADAAPMITPAT
ncbi:MAG TPA: GMC family oxidoreductase [Candidatus Dormibacteraeota bacterium]